MRLSTCPACAAPLQTGTLVCTACGTAIAIDPVSGEARSDIAFCANRKLIACDWAAPGPGAYCPACMMTEVVPDDLAPGNRLLWARAEAAKRRVLTGLRRWGWFAPEDDGPRPVFHLLSERTSKGESHVTMGHANGLITLDVSEADHAERIRRREDLREPLRSMTGHIRHELAHLLQARLLAEKPGFAEAFRPLFGDEREDYGAALERHYAEGAPEGWEETHVSAYATMHAHEDWAETAAHLMHLADLADSAASAGLAADHLPEGWDAYGEEDAETLVTRASAVALALTHVTRGMGVEDPYPFVLTSRIREKLAEAHRWIASGPGA